MSVNFTKPSDYDSTVEAVCTLMLPIQQANILTGRYKSYKSDSMPVTCPENLSMRCYEYLSDGGVGYVLEFTCIFNSLIYKKKVNVGPGKWNTQDWRVC